MKPYSQGYFNVEIDYKIRTKQQTDDMSCVFLKGISVDTYRHTKIICVIKWNIEQVPQDLQFSPTLSYWRSLDVCSWWGFYGNESVFPSVEFYCNLLSFFSQLFKTLSHTKPNLTSCQNDVIRGRKVPHCAMFSSERFRSIVEGRHVKGGIEL